MSKNKHYKPDEEFIENAEIVEDELVVEEDEVEETVVEPEVFEPIRGIVENCTTLNVRETPSEGNNVISKLTSGVEVEIDPDFEDDTFYKVCTAAGVEGYCMKQFITILD